MRIIILLLAVLAAYAYAQSANIGIGGPPSTETMLTLAASLVVALVMSFSRTLREQKNAQITMRVLFAETVGGALLGVITTLLVSTLHELTFNGAVALSGIGAAFGWRTLSAIGAVVGGKYGLKLEQKNSAPEKKKGVSDNEQLP